MKKYKFLLIAIPLLISCKTYPNMSKDSTKLFYQSSDSLRVSIKNGYTDNIDSAMYYKGKSDAYYAMEGLIIEFISKQK